ncbi:MAG: hypothetical protein ACP5NV_02425 [Candidatus Woesearchaeota archaeon]
MCSIDDTIYDIKEIPLFAKKFRKIIPLNKQYDIKRRIRKLSYNPYTGKPLGYKYLRELKIDKFRIYYIISEKEIVVLLITISDKKNQKETIEYIKRNIKEFEKMIKNLNSKE